MPMAKAKMWDSGDYNRVSKELLPIKRECWVIHSTVRCKGGDFLINTSYVTML